MREITIFPRIKVFASAPTKTRIRQHEICDFIVVMTLCGAQAPE